MVTHARELKQQTDTKLESELAADFKKVYMTTQLYDNEVEEDRIKNLLKLK